MKLLEAASILGISLEEVTIETLKTSFRKLTMAWDAEKNKDPQAKLRFVQITEAYKKLNSVMEGKDSFRGDDSHEIAAFMRMFMDMVGMSDTDSIPAAAMTFGMMFGSHHNSADEWSTDDDAEYEDEDEDDEEAEYAPEDFYEDFTPTPQQLANSLFHGKNNGVHDRRLPPPSHAYRSATTTSGDRGEANANAHVQDEKKVKQAKKRAEKRKKQKEKKGRDGQGIGKLSAEDAVIGEESEQAPEQTTATKYATPSTSTAIASHCHHHYHHTTANSVTVLMPTLSGAGELTNSLREQFVMCIQTGRAEVFEQILDQLQRPALHLDRDFIRQIKQELPTYLLVHKCVTDFREEKLPAESPREDLVRLADKRRGMARKLLFLDDPIIDLNLYDDEGLSVLHKSIILWDLEFSRWIIQLIRDGIGSRRSMLNLNSRCRKKGWAPIHYAVASLNVPAMMDLAHNGANLQASSATDKKLTPLELARQQLKANQTAERQREAYERVLTQLTELISWQKTANDPKKAQKAAAAAAAAAATANQPAEGAASQKPREAEKRREAAVAENLSEKPGMENKISAPPAVVSNTPNSSNQLHQNSNNGNNNTSPNPPATSANATTSGKKKKSEQKRKEGDEPVAPAPVPNTPSAPAESKKTEPPAVTSPLPAKPSSSTKTPPNTSTKSNRGGTNARSKAGNAPTPTAASNAAGNAASAPSSSISALAMSATSRDEVVDRLLAMGFREADCLAATALYGTDMDRAISWLCERPEDNKPVAKPPPVTKSGKATAKAETAATAAKSAAGSGKKAVGNVSATAADSQSHVAPTATHSSGQQGTTTAAATEHAARLQREKEELRRINRAWNAKTEDEKRRLKKQQEEERMKEILARSQPLGIQQHMGGDITTLSSLSQGNHVSEIVPEVDFPLPSSHKSQGPSSVKMSNNLSHQSGVIPIAPTLGWSQSLSSTAPSPLFTALPAATPDVLVPNDLLPRAALSSLNASSTVPSSDFFHPAPLPEPLLGDLTGGFGLAGTGPGLPFPHIGNGGGATDGLFPPPISRQSTVSNVPNPPGLERDLSTTLSMDLGGFPSRDASAFATNGREEGVVTGAVELSAGARPFVPKNFPLSSLNYPGLTGLPLTDTSSLLSGPGTSLWAQAPSIHGVHTSSSLGLGIGLYSSPPGITLLGDGLGTAGMTTASSRSYFGGLLPPSDVAHDVGLFDAGAIDMPALNIDNILSNDDPTLASLVLPLTPGSPSTATQRAGPLGSTSPTTGGGRQLSMRKADTAS